MISEQDLQFIVGAVNQARVATNLYRAVCEGNPCPAAMYFGTDTSVDRILFDGELAAQVRLAIEETTEIQKAKAIHGGNA